MSGEGNGNGRRRFLVIRHPRVDADVAEQIHYIIEKHDEPDGALAWAEGLDEVYARLDVLPHRYPVVEATRQFPRPIRKIVYHSHLVFYEVFEPQAVVRVLYVWHAARGRLPDFARRHDPPPGG